MFLLVFLICVFVPSINDAGIVVGANIKVAYYDIIALLYLSYILAKGKWRKFSKIPVFQRIIVFYLIMIICGMSGIFGNPVSSIIRELRNVALLIITFCMVYEYFEKKRMDVFKLMSFIAVILIMCCLYNVIKGHNSSNWFLFYRANGNITVACVCYFIAESVRKDIHMKKKIIALTLGILCITCSLLSQERLQIVAIAGAGLLIISSYFLTKRCKHNLVHHRISQKKLIGVFAIIIVGITLVMYISSLPFAQKYIDYYLTYRIGSVYQNGSLKMDGSLNARLYQLQFVIEKTNPLNFLLGNGLGYDYPQINGYITAAMDSSILWIYKDMGILGVFSFMWIVYYTIRRLVNLKSESVRSISAALLAVLILIIFIPNFMGSSSDACALGILLGIAALQKKRYCMRTEK